MNVTLPEQQKSSSPARLSEAWINAIFEEFHGRFGNPFFAKFQSGSLDANGNDQGIENAKTVWAKRLAEFTPEEIARGINTEYSFPPDLDTFRKACRPSLDYEAAFNEACQQMHLRKEGRDHWSNPAIYHAASRIGMDMNNPYAYIKTRWKTELDKAIYDVAAGNSPSVIAKRVNPSGYLAAPKREQGNYTSTALNSLANINEVLNKMPAWKMKKMNPGEQEGATV